MDGSRQMDNRQAVGSRPYARQLLGVIQIGSQAVGQTAAEAFGKAWQGLFRDRSAVIAMIFLIFLCGDRDRQGSMHNQYRSQAVPMTQAARHSYGCRFFA
ncbi:hypothetical protein CBF45_05820 [Bordetella sp. J329]|nr:hypothetical protein CBF45_05820 [Bordetella sp. J329]